MTSVIRIGTRGSRLALAQTQLVMDALHSTAPDTSFEVRVIQTSGDAGSGAIVGDGVFVKEIQRALLDDEIDIAVHSLKDLPTEEPQDLVIAAIPERGDPREVVFGAKLSELGSGSRVGTGSPRRMAQLRSLRPDLESVSIRGNVPTRVAKVRAGEVDAAILAAAGLVRLGIEIEGETLSASDFLPAPGQGALAVEAPASSSLIDVIGSIDHSSTRAAVEAERSVLRNLGGGCLLPVAALGRVEANELILDALVVSSDGQRKVKARSRGPVSDHDWIADRCAQELIKQNAMDLLG